MAKRTDNTASQRSKRYIVRQKERGLIRVKAWVPETRKQDLMAFAKQLREDEAKKSPPPEETNGSQNEVE